MTLLAQLQSATIDRIKAESNNCLTGKIDSYNAEKRMASIEISLTRSIGPLPIIHNVPVHFMGGDESGLTFPLKKGTPVLVVFSDRSLDEWKSTGGPVEPADPRMHALSDAIAIPGILPFGARAADPKSVVLHHGRSKLTLRHNGDLEITGKLIVSDDVVVQGVSLKDHKHDAGEALIAPQGPVEGVTGGPSLI